MPAPSALLGIALLVAGVVLAVRVKPVPLPVTEADGGRMAG
jgi:hypothetical protein